MKKNYLFGMLALAAMTMVGCSNDEVVNDYSQDNAIQFGTYVGRGASSRAHVIDTKTLGTEGFGVFAYYHKGENNTPGAFSTTSTPDFMYNEKVYNNGEWSEENGFSTGWTYDIVKYWPNNVNDRVSFFAYAPYKEDFKLAENAAGDPTIPYSVKVANGIATPNNNVDLLYLKEPQLNLQKQTIDNKVIFTFEHALSRIAFAAKVLVDEVNGDQTGTKNEETHELNSLAEGTEITINSVKINGKFYTAGELNLNRPAPVNNDELKTGWMADKFTASEEIISYELTAANFVDGANEFEGKDVKSEALNNDESYLMIMPQNFEEGNEITITVDYNVVTEDAKLTAGNGKSDIHNIITSVPFTFDFEEGKAYKFTLHLGMTSVKLSASVTPWGEDEDWSVNVPINNDNAGTGNPEWDNYYGNETSEGGEQGGNAPAEE